MTAVDLDGTSVLVSIRDVFHRAHQLRTLTGEIPTVTLALYRLLLAIMYRAISTDDPTGMWKKLWHAATLPERIQEYLSEYADRFDLTHPTQPFYQVADLRTAKDEFSGLERLIADVPNGEPYFTNRAGWRLASIPLDEAARWLVHCQMFDPSGIKSGAVGDVRVKGGRGYPIGTAWAGNLGCVLLEGATVKETLLLNLCLGELGASNQLWSSDDDTAIWERPLQTAAEEEPGRKTGEIPGRPPRGPADLLTWQSRRVRLRVEGDRVTGVLICNGDPLSPQNRYGAEPMSGWRYSVPQTKKFKVDVYMPRTHDPERSMWRGIGALLPQAEQPRQTANGDGGYVAPTITWVRRFIGGPLPADTLLQTRAVGMCYGSQSSVVADVFDDVLTIHAALLASADLQHLALLATTIADRAAFAVGDLARDLALANGGDGNGDRDRAREQAYYRLDVPFRHWLFELSVGSVPDQVLDAWTKRARPVIESLGGELIDAAGPAAWRGRPDPNGRLMDVGRASLSFQGSLARAFTTSRTPEVDSVIGAS